MQVKKESQQNQSRWWIWYHDTAWGIPNVLASIASESPVKTKSERHNVPLSSLNVQQTSTERPVLGASSSNYSEWNIDEKWSSQEWKSGEMSGARTGRPVDDNFVIDDDMDSDTATASNLSLRSRSFLNRVNDRLRKMLDHSPEDAMQDIDKTFHYLVNVYVFNIGSICIHGKELLRNFTFHQKYREESHFKAGVRHIWEVDSGTNGWDCGSVSNQLGKFSMKKSSVSRMQRFMYSQILCDFLERWIRTQHQIASLAKWLQLQLWN